MKITFFTILTTFITSHVQQYKHERECNSIICQLQDDKIRRLEYLMDGVLSSEEYVNEEVSSLANENMVHILHLVNFSRLNPFSIIYYSFCTCNTDSEGKTREPSGDIKERNGVKKRARRIGTL